MCDFRRVNVSVYDSIDDRLPHGIDRVVQPPDVQIVDRGPGDGRQLGPEVATLLRQALELLRAGFATEGADAQVIGRL